jgi:hypothetical protein
MYVWEYKTDSKNVTQNAVDGHVLGEICKSDYRIHNKDSNEDERQNESERTWNKEAILGGCRRLRLRTGCPVEQLPHIAGRRCVGRLLRFNKQATTTKSADVQRSRKPHKPSSIEILKVAVVPGVLKCHLQVFLHFRNFLKIIWHLKTLHVWEQALSGKAHSDYGVQTLNNPS